MTRRNYKPVNLKTEDWQIIKDLAEKLEKSFVIPSPSLPDVIMLCVNHYRMTLAESERKEARDLE